MIVSNSDICLLPFIKDSAEFLKTPTSIIFNKSINSDIVPEDMEFARVKPIFMKNGPLDVRSSRPVSILGVVLNILERSISTQLYDFIKSRNMRSEIFTCLYNILMYINFMLFYQSLYISYVILSVCMICAYEYSMFMSDLLPEQN